MKYESLEARILANSVCSAEHFYEHPDGEITPCWVWLGQTNSRGYPRMCIRRKGAPRNVFVHRLVVIEILGYALQFEVARHLCNFQQCVSPLHLLPATQSENMQQCVTDGRHNSQRREPGED